MCYFLQDYYSLQRCRKGTCANIIFCTSADERVGLHVGIGADVCESAAGADDESTACVDVAGVTTLSFALVQKIIPADIPLRHLYNE